MIRDNALLNLTEYLKQRFNNVVLNYDETVIAVIRPLSFILLVADFMQNSFTPIHVTKIYEPIFNLSAEIGIAIPLSAEVCTTAIFAWLGGSLKTKLGLKKLLFSGATISLLGFLICGIFVVYLGPLLAPKLEKLFSKKINMIIGSLLSVVALGLFALKPSLTTAVIALIILGVADSFTFTAQNIYYNTLEIVNKFGISKANGIKNTFENIAYVMAPAIFGIAMLSGISYGILLIALTSLVLLGLFFINLENLKKG